MKGYSVTDFVVNFDDGRSIIDTRPIIRVEEVEHRICVVRWDAERNLTITGIYFVDAIRNGVPDIERSHQVYADTFKGYIVRAVSDDVRQIRLPSGPVCSFDGAVFSVSQFDDDTFLITVGHYDSPAANMIYAYDNCGHRKWTLTGFEHDRGARAKFTRLTNKLFTAHNSELDFIEPYIAVDNSIWVETTQTYPFQIDPATGTLIGEANPNAPLSRVG